MDDARLLQLIAWSMSSQSNCGPPGGGGSIRREDVWQMLGACRRFTNDPGPDLLLLEAQGATISDRMCSDAQRALRAAHAAQQLLMRASHGAPTRALAYASGRRTRKEHAEVIEQQRPMQDAARIAAQGLAKAIESGRAAVDTGAMEPPAASVAWVRQRIAWAAGRRARRSKHGGPEADGLLEAAADYALAHMLRGRKAGALWTQEAVARRVAWINDDGQPQIGVDQNRMNRVCRAADAALAEARDEAMSKFRREVIAALRA